MTRNSLMMFRSCRSIARIYSMYWSVIVHDRNIINIDFILIDQMQKKIQRTFKHL